LGVCPQLLETIQALEYKRPTKIQAEAIPIALQGHDIIGLAETGSGKTAAYVIPILQSLLQNPRKVYALVLAPTRELGYQISEQFEALGASIGVKCAVIVGGMDLMQQQIALARKPHIIIGTPGRLIAHLENTKGFSIRTIKYLVLDEADRLLNMDFEEEIDKILRVAPRDRHTYLYSATMTQKVKKLQRASLVNPVKVQVSSKYQTVDTLQQQYLFVPHKYKEAYLVLMLNEFAGNTVIIFASTCATTSRLTLILRNLGFSAIPINGDMSQDKRLNALSQFKTGQRNILVATDVASRGLDIPTVDFVLNYDVPGNSKDYIHRVGRTARAGRAGRAVTMVTQYDVELYQRIEELIKRKLPVFPASDEQAMILVERVNEAQRIAATQLKELGLVKSLNNTSSAGTPELAPNGKRKHNSKKNPAKRTKNR